MSCLTGHQIAEAAKQVLGHEDFSVANPTTAPAVIERDAPPGQTVSEAVMADILALAETLPAAPPPVPPKHVTKLQFAKALTKQSPPIITTDEAKAWVASGTVPQLALDAIAASDMTQEEKDDAEMDAAGATEIPRLSPLVLMLQAHPDISMTDEERDALFVFAATL